MIAVKPQLHLRKKVSAPAPPRDQWFSKEYLGGAKSIKAMLRGFSPLPADQSKFRFFYGANNGTTNFKKHMLFDTEPTDAAAQPTKD